MLHKNNNEKVPSWEGQVSDSSETGVGNMAPNKLRLTDQYSLIVSDKIISCNPSAITHPNLLNPCSIKIFKSPRNSLNIKLIFNRLL